MKILSQNAKMKKPNKHNADLFNFGIPAYKSSTGLITCPNASTCLKGCYAKSGAYTWSNVQNAYEKRLELTQDALFVPRMIEEINSKINLSKKRDKGLTLVRIHDSGDFYSLAYTLSWFKIMTHFEISKDVRFYAYTKQIEMFQGLNLPKNFKLIQSIGGKQDKSIDLTKPHARVFKNKEDLDLAGYIDATNDDTIAGIDDTVKIGLIYHGVKNYENTTWQNTRI